MTTKIHDQVENLLYRKMTNKELKAMTTEELQFFWGNLHNWAELAAQELQKRKDQSPTL